MNYVVGTLIILLMAALCVIRWLAERIEFKKHDEDECETDSTYKEE